MHCWPSLLNRNESMFDRSQLTASCADSFITSPSCPVRVISPIPDPPSLPLSMRLASTYMISPPVRVQARPAATPGLFNSWALSRSYRIGPESNNIQWCICLRQAPSTTPFNKTPRFPTLSWFFQGGENYGQAKLYSHCRSAYIFPI